MNGDAIRRAINGAPETVKLRSESSGYGMNRGDNYRGDGFYGDSDLVMKRRGSVRRKGHKCDVSRSRRNPAYVQPAEMTNTGTSGRVSGRSVRGGTQTSYGAFLPPVAAYSDGVSVLRDSQQIRTDRTRTVRHPGNPKIR